MPKRVYNNVVDHRLLDGSLVVEDVTSVTLPDLEHPTTTINVSGMAAAIDMPNPAQLNAMQFSISHNNGLNCEGLSMPSRHQFELRVVRQRYNVALTDQENESMKVRVIGVPKKTSKGSLERGNPYGSTVDYAVFRYEEEIDGKVVTLISPAEGIITINGKSYTSQVQSMLE